MTEVVAALIWNKDKFMICQCPAHKVSGLLWILVFFACALFKIFSSIKQKSVPSFNK